MLTGLMRCWLAIWTRGSCPLFYFRCIFMRWWQNSVSGLEKKSKFSKFLSYRICGSASLLLQCLYHHHECLYRGVMTPGMTDRRSFLYVCRKWVKQKHSSNPHPSLSTAWTRSLNLSLTPEEKNPSTRSPERLSLRTKTESTGGQSHILILGQRTRIWYEPGNSPIDCRVSPRSALSFNGPLPARQSHIKKMPNCKF